MNGRGKTSFGRDHQRPPNPNNILLLSDEEEEVVMLSSTLLEEIEGNDSTTDLPARSSNISYAQCAHFAKTKSPSPEIRNSKTILASGIKTPSVASIPAPRDLCVFATVGKCRFGQLCRNEHGIQCPRCLLNCLHPTHLAQNERHLEKCRAVELPEESPSRVGEMPRECGICLEVVEEKPDPRYGLMTCDHVFCLGCIRRWRSQQAHREARMRQEAAASQSGASAGSAQQQQQQLDVPLQTSCPLCRQVTYFVVPSSVWAGTADEKARIIGEYKERMSRIPCKYHFDSLLSRPAVVASMGPSARLIGCDTECPFGTSCFYRHGPSPDEGGSDAPQKAHLRACVDGDRRVKVVQETKLSDFFASKCTVSSEISHINKKM